MKYIMIFSLFFLCFVGCTKNDSFTESTRTQEVQAPTKSISTGGNMSEFLSITGILNTIFISGYNVIYKDLFLVNIPKDLDIRSYETFDSQYTKNEKIAFFENTYTKYFYLTLLHTDTLNISRTNKDICLQQTEYIGSPTETKETTIKNISNKEIFITQITFFTEGNIPPYDYTHITHFCFVEKNIMYDLVLDNYKFSEANKILDSFTFLD